MVNDLGKNREVSCPGPTYGNSSNDNEQMARALEPTTAAGTVPLTCVYPSLTAYYPSKPTDQRIQHADRTPHLAHVGKTGILQSTSSCDGVICWGPTIR